MSGNSFEMALLWGLLVVGVGVAGFIGLQVMARNALSPTLSFEPREPRIGSKVKVKVRLNPTREVTISGACVTIRCRKSWVDPELGMSPTAARLYNVLRINSSYERSGGLFSYDYERRRRHMYREQVNDEVLCQHQAQFPSWSGQLTPGQPVEWEGELEVPREGALPTDKMSGLTITWEVEVHFDIPNFPDAYVTRGLTVHSRNAIPAEA